MKILSWYVKGIGEREQALIKLINKIEPNICCVQNTMKLEKNIPVDIQTLKDYHCYINGKIKGGGNGILTLTDIKPESEDRDIEDKEFNIAGQVERFKFENFYLYNVFLPHIEDKNKEQRKAFIESFIKEAIALKDQGNSVILAGQFNIAHAEIDVYNPKKNKTTAGFRKQDRKLLEKLLHNGFVDAYRLEHPDTQKFTTWDSAGKEKREWIKEEGWRTDMFLVSDDLKNKIISCDIFDEIYGSNHVPILQDINI